jgi:hypothetical protein
VLSIASNLTMRGMGSGVNLRFFPRKNKVMVPVITTIMIMMMMSITLLKLKQ